MVLCLRSARPRGPFVLPLTGRDIMILHLQSWRICHFLYSSALDVIQYPKLFSFSFSSNSKLTWNYKYHGLMDPALSMYLFLKLASLSLSSWWVHLFSFMLSALYTRISVAQCGWGVELWLGRSTFISTSALEIHQVTLASHSLSAYLTYFYGFLLFNNRINYSNKRRCLICSELLDKRRAIYRINK